MSDESNADAPKHPIAVVAARTGLSPDVLRVWERRYRAVTPVRTLGGQRLYSDADIERLRMLSAATSAGRAIGQVAGLDTAEIARLVDEDLAARERRGGEQHTWSSSAGMFVDEAFQAALALDGRRLEELLRRAIARFGIPPVLESVAAPLLERIGDGWHSGRVTIAQEHLASSVVQDVVAASLRALVSPDGAPRMLVATLTGERHTIGALLAAAVGAVAGWEVVFLGGDLPADEIARAAIAARARLVAISIIYASDGDRVANELRLLRGRLPEETRVVVGGTAAASFARRLQAPGVHVTGTLEGFSRELEAARGAR